MLKTLVIYISIFSNTHVYYINNKYILRVDMDESLQSPYKYLFIDRYNETVFYIDKHLKRAYSELIEKNEIKGSWKASGSRLIEEKEVDSTKAYLKLQAIKIEKYISYVSPMNQSKSFVKKFHQTYSNFELLDTFFKVFTEHELISLNKYDGTTPSHKDKWLLEDYYEIKKWNGDIIKTYRYKLNKYAEKEIKESFFDKFKNIELASWERLISHKYH